MQNSDETMSVIEDLDPEPPPKRSARTWEVIVGMVLLVAVLGFAGWEWVHQNQQQNNYREGTDAMRPVRTGMSAQAHFAAASGYLDADKQAQAVATKITQRDDQYRIATSRSNSGDWIACLKAIQQVEAIEPGYKDLAQIEKKATGQIYRGAMSGTVALRLDANPSGLYYYGANGWVWLPKSDRYSKVQGAGVSDWLLYDVPGPEWVQPAPPTPTTSSSQLTSPQLAKRLLTAAKMPDLSKTVTLSIDPEQYYYFGWGENGLWGFHDAGVHENYQSPLGVSYWPSSTVTYQSYNSPATSTVQLK